MSEGICHYSSKESLLCASWSSRARLGMVKDSISVQSVEKFLSLIVGLLGLVVVMHVMARTSCADHCLSARVRLWRGLRGFYTFRCGQEHVSVWSMTPSPCRVPWFHLRAGCLGFAGFVKVFVGRLVVGCDKTQGWLNAVGLSVVVFYVRRFFELARFHRAEVQQNARVDDLGYPTPSGPDLGPGHRYPGFGLAGESPAAAFPGHGGRVPGAVSPTLGDMVGGLCVRISPREVVSRPVNNQVFDLESQPPCGCPRPWSPGSLALGPSRVAGRCKQAGHQLAASVWLVLGGKAAACSPSPRLWLSLRITACVAIPDGKGPWDLPGAPRGS